jgi:hypothetical protein
MIEEHVYTIFETAVSQLGLRPYQVVVHLHSETSTVEIQEWDKQKK